MLQNFYSRSTLQVLGLAIWIPVACAGSVAPNEPTRPAVRAQPERVQRVAALIKTARLHYAEQRFRDAALTAQLALNRLDGSYDTPDTIDDTGLHLALSAASFHQGLSTEKALAHRCIGIAASRLGMLDRKLRDKPSDSSRSAIDDVITEGSPASSTDFCSHWAQENPTVTLAYQAPARPQVETFPTKTCGTRREESRRGLIAAKESFARQDFPLADGLAFDVLAVLGRDCAVPKALDMDKHARERLEDDIRNGMLTAKGAAKRRIELAERWLGPSGDSASPGLKR